MTAAEEQQPPKGTSSYANFFKIAPGLKKKKILLLGSFTFPRTENIKGGAVGGTPFAGSWVGIVVG